MAKPRSDKAIKPEHKPVLRAWLVEENLSYAEVRERMKAQWGFAVGTGTLSRFWATDCFAPKFTRAKELADGLDLPAEQFDSRIIAAVKHTAFELALNKEGNVQALQRLLKILGDSAKLKIKERELALDERRVAILESKAAEADQAKAVAGDAALSPTEKEARIKAVFGLR